MFSSIKLPCTNSKHKVMKLIRTHTFLAIKTMMRPQRLRQLANSTISQVHHTLLSSTRKLSRHRRLLDILYRVLLLNSRWIKCVNSYVRVLVCFHDVMKMQVVHTWSFITGCGFWLALCGFIVEFLKSLTLHPVPRLISSMPSELVLSRWGVGLISVSGFLLVFFNAAFDIVHWYLDSAHVNCASKVAWIFVRGDYVRDKELYEHGNVKWCKNNAELDSYEIK